MAYLDDHVVSWLLIVVIFVLSLLAMITAQDSGSPASSKTQSLSRASFITVAVLFAFTTLYWGKEVFCKTQLQSTIWGAAAVAETLDTLKEASSIVTPAPGFLRKGRVVSCGRA